MPFLPFGLMSFECAADVEKHARPRGAIEAGPLLSAERWTKARRQVVGTVGDGIFGGEGQRKARAVMAGGCICINCPWEKAPSSDARSAKPPLR